MKKYLLALMLLIATPAHAANQAISAMNNGSPAQTGDLVHIARNVASVWTDFSLSVGDYLTYVGQNITTASNLASVGTITTGTWNATPVAGMGYGPAGYVSGRYYSVPSTASMSTKAVGANTMVYWPLVVTKTNNFTAIGYNCTSNASSANAHFGIYRSNSSGLPGSLVAGTDVTVASVGVAVADATFSGAVSLTPALYWQAALSSANNLTFTAGSSANMNGAFLGIGTFQASGTAQGIFMTSSQTYGALPSTAPSVSYTEATASPFFATKAQ